MDEKEKLFGLMTLAEEQQKELNKIVEQLRAERIELEKARHSLAPEIDKSVSKVITRSMAGISDYAGEEIKLAGKHSIQQLSELTANASKATEGIKGALNRLSYHEIRFYTFVSFGLVVMPIAFALFLLWWIPSFEEVQRLKADYERYGIEYGTCGGKPCVRVMKKECNHGESGDFCVIDPL